ncbi:MAG: hypothetical protein ACI9NN_001201, partial [Bacteroidia bacterium]
LGNLEGDFSFDDWSAIASTLDKAQNKRRAAMWWIIAAGCLLLIGTFFFVGSEKQSIETKATTAEVSPTQESIVNNIPTTPSKANDGVDQVIDQKHASTSTNRSSKEDLFVDPLAVVKRIKVASSPKTISAINKLVVRSRPFADRATGILGQYGLVLPQLDHLELLDITLLESGKFLPTPEATNSPKTLSSKGRWELGLSASPSIASKLIRSNKEYAWLLNRRYSDLANTSERRNVSYQLSLDANYFLNDHWYLNTGLTFNQLSEQVSYNFVIDDIPVPNYEQKVLRYGPRQPNQFVSVQYGGNNTYNFIQIPFKLGTMHTIMQDRLELRSEFGFQYMNLISAKGEKMGTTILDLVNLADKQLRQTIYKRHNLGAGLNFGLYCPIGDRWNLGGTSYFETALLSQRNSDSPLKDRPYSYGFNINLNYSLLSKK